MATDILSHSQILKNGENALLVKPDSKAIAEGLKKLITDNDFAVLDAKSDLDPGITIEAKCLIARNTKLSTGYTGFVKIGSDTIIGENCIIHGPGGIEIGDDVWIGTGAIIKDDLVIGKGCVIEAGSVINKSIPDYSIVSGNPAKIVATRK